MLMSGCFSSVSQVYRKRDRLDPGGDDRCDGAEHDRGCAYEPRWPRLQVRCRGDSGESRNRAGEPLKARFGSDTETVRTARKSLTPFAERRRRMALTRVDWHIFGPLVGSLPGILLGSYLSARVSELALRITLCG